MKKVVIYYNFIIISIVVFTGFIQAQTTAQIISALLFFPLFIYFGQFIIPQRRKAVPRLLPVDSSPSVPLHIAIQEKSPRVSDKKEQLKEGVLTDEAEIVEEGTILKHFDIDRRMFLKLIGSAGITVFLFSLFTNKAQGAFFGSVPGPGTVSLKDTTGAKIDPAIKQPTDGYKLAQLDDATSTAYYGYLNKDSAWYILKEDSTGAYRYVKGTSSFSTNWTNRASLTYDYFDSVF